MQFLDKAKPKSVTTPRINRDLQCAIALPPLFSPTFSVEKYEKLHFETYPKNCLDTLKKTLTFPAHRDWQNYAAWTEMAMKPSENSNEPSQLDPQNTTSSSRISHHRVGIYFEFLLGFWLKNSPFFEICVEHLQIRMENTKKTIGEIDLILRNTETNAMEHWECALKFYFINTKAKTLYDFKGPEQKDTLGNKLDHMLGHQLQLQLSGFSQTCEEILKKSELVKMQISKHVCLIKGVFFLPWSYNPTDKVNFDSLSINVTQFLNRESCFKYWVEFSNLKAFVDSEMYRTLVEEQAKSGLTSLVDPKSLVFVLLKKIFWLAPLETADFFLINSMHPETIFAERDFMNHERDAAWQDHFDSPQLVAILHLRKFEDSNDVDFMSQIDVKEISRFFLVSSGWKRKFLS